MSEANFPQEGLLPTLPGGKAGKRFRTYKKIPIRAYCWLSKVRPGTWLVSHYVYKNRGKLDPADTRRVGDNWLRIERDGDER